MNFTVQRIRSSDPNAVALAVMGRTARATANSFTVREWMGSLAAKAPGEKNYEAQLRLVFNELVKRWRYVMETGEWVHGTPRSLLAHVLGARYNRGPTCPNPERCDVANTPWPNPGWGDCDDIATLAAACALGLGLTPFWRVSRAPSGSHVAVTVQLPDGQLIELDPVGWPEHGFNWAPSGPGVTTEFYSLDGTRIHGMNGYRAPYQQHFLPPAPVPPGLGRPFGAGQVGVSFMLGGVTSGDPLPQTLVGELMVGDFGAIQPFQFRAPLHLAAVGPNDRRGARVLAIPGYQARLMRRGVVWHRTPAVDQFGQWWSYNADMDVWLPRGHRMDRDWTSAFPPGTNAARKLAGQYYGAITAERRQRRAERKQRRRARIRRGFQKVGRVLKKVGQGIRKVVGKVLNSKFVQTIVAGVLQVFGVPMMVTKKLMTIAGNFAGKGGLIKLLKLARKNPKEALKFLASTVKAAGHGEMLKQMKVPGFAGLSYGFTGFEPTLYQVRQDGGTFYGAPVEAIVGLPGVYEFGQAMELSPTPSTGRWYRVKKGDTLIDMVKRAYGPNNVKEHVRWVVSAQANAYARRASDPGFETNYIGPETLTLRPLFHENYEDNQSGDVIGARPGPGESKYLPILWFPATAGDEPASVVPVPEDDEGTEELPDIEDLPPEGEDVQPTPMPVPPDSDDEEFVDVVPDDMPPLGPIVPVFPDGGEPMPPSPEEAHEQAHDQWVPAPVVPANQRPSDGAGGAGAVAAAGLLALLFI